MADGDAQQVVDRRLVLEQAGLRREEPRSSSAPAWESSFERDVGSPSPRLRDSGSWFHAIDATSGLDAPRCRWGARRWP